MGFKERVNQRIKEANPTEMLDEKTAEGFGNTIFSTLPTALRNRCIFNILTFVGVGLLTAILAIAYGAYPLLICSAVLILFGIVTVLFILNNFKKGNILEITGVIIAKDKEGYRKQHKYINIEDDCHRVYRLLITEKVKRYKIGDIIVFYTTKDSISQPVDAEYRVFKTYAIERFNASVSNEEEEKDNFEDLVIKPKSE